MKKLSLIAAVSLCLAGCVAVPIPHERLATPIVEGTVSDAISKAPLSGARISAITSDSDNHTTVTSDATGKFRAYAFTSSSWYYFTPLNLEGFCVGHFTVEKEGYKSLSFVEKYFGWGGNDGICSSQPVQRSIELERLERDGG